MVKIKDIAALEERKRESESEGERGGGKDISGLHSAPLSVYPDNISITRNQQTNPLCADVSFARQCLILALSVYLRVYLVRSGLSVLSGFFTSIANSPLMHHIGHWTHPTS